MWNIPVYIVDHIWLIFLVEYVIWIKVYWEKHDAFERCLLVKQQESN